MGFLLKYDFTVFLMLCWSFCERKQYDSAYGDDFQDYSSFQRRNKPKTPSFQFGKSSLRLCLCMWSVHFSPPLVNVNFAYYSEIESFAHYLLIHLTLDCL